MITGLRRRLGITRERVAWARLYAERTALSFRSASTDRGRILCYHSVGQPDYGVNDVTPRAFRRQIELALADGHRFVPASAIAETGGDPGDLAVTFDDGLRSVLATAVPILDEYGVPATCFVVTSWPEHAHDWQRERALDWAGIRELAAAGVRIGSHSVSHPRFSEVTPDEARRELVDSRERLERELGRSVDEFAIPFGVTSAWCDEHTELAHELGYRHVFAQSEDRRPVGTVPRTFVTSVDDDRRFSAALRGAYDGWEEWS